MKTVRVAAPWICVLMLLVLANSLLLNHVPGRQTPDELIPVGVIQHIRATSSLDTDWAHVSSFPDHFKRAHFNFSGYILAGAAFTAATRTPSDYGSLLNRLRQFSRFCTLALLLLVFTIARRLWGDGYALLATFAALSAPLLFQDAHYARPEAFGTLLFTCVFALVVLGNDYGKRDLIRLLLIATVCGFLVSIKVTYAAATVFAVPVIWRCASRHVAGIRTWQRTMALLLLAGLLFMAGFGLGAPHALQHPKVYLQGLHGLAHAYSNGMPPHSRPEYEFVSELGWIGGYFALTLGWIALLLHPVGYFNRDINTCQRSSLFTFLIMVAVTVLFFAHEHVFFERNFSHLLPSFLIISVGGLKVIVRTSTAITPISKTITCAGTAIVLFALWQLTPVQVSRKLHHTFSAHAVRTDDSNYAKLLGNISHQIGTTHVQPIGFSDVYAGKYPAANIGSCVLYNITTYGDPWSKKFITDLPPSFRIAQEIPSLFAGIPTSTLQTYQSATYYLIYDSASCKAQRN